MPFTFAHPAIILPFCKKPAFFSMSGLIIGSMAPDFEYFLRMNIKSTFSHQFSGIFVFDLPISILVAFIFHNIIRNSLIKNLPFCLYKRFNSYLTFNWNHYFYHHWFMVIISILIGIMSHILWDSFTHLSGYFVHHYLTLLQNTISIYTANIALFKLMQHGSSIIGMLIIVLFIRHLPTTRVSQNKINLFYWGSVFTLTFLFILSATIFLLPHFGRFVVICTDALFIGLTVTPIIMRCIKSQQN